MKGTIGDSIFLKIFPIYEIVFVISRAKMLAIVEITSSIFPSRIIANIFSKFKLIFLCDLWSEVNIKKLRL